MSFRDSFRNIYYGPREILLREVDADSTLLDLGCGQDSLVRHLPDSVKRTGVDLYEPSIEISRKNKIHHDYAKINILEALDHFGPKSFDHVTAMDVIEHLDREEGETLINVMEGLARKKVLILTPNGFVPQSHPDNPWQLHRSGWDTSDFSSRGYSVTGLHGWKALRGAMGNPIIKPEKLGNYISFLSEPIIHRNPKLSFHIFSVKDMSQFT
jgi:hypothetical protein